MSEPSQMPENLPPYPPIPKGFDRWVYRGNGGSLDHACTYAYTDTEGNWREWIISKWERKTQGATDLHYLEAVRDNPTPAPSPAEPSQQARSAAEEIYSAISHIDGPNAETMAAIIERETGVGEARQIIRAYISALSDGPENCGAILAEKLEETARAYLAKNHPPVAASDLPKIPPTLPDGRYFWRCQPDHHWSMVQVIGMHRLSGEVFSGMPFLEDVVGQMSRAYDMMEPEIGDALARPSHQAREHYNTIKPAYETTRSKNQS